jgi:hypothetical protein
MIPRSAQDDRVWIFGATAPFDASASIKNAFDLPRLDQPLAAFTGLDRA